MHELVETLSLNVIPGRLHDEDRPRLDGDGDLGFHQGEHAGGNLRKWLFLDVVRGQLASQIPKFDLRGKVVSVPILTQNHTLAKGTGSNLTEKGADLSKAHHPTSQQEDFNLGHITVSQ